MVALAVTAVPVQAARMVATARMTAAMLPVKIATLAMMVASARIAIALPMTAAMLPMAAAIVLGRGHRRRR